MAHGGNKAVPIILVILTLAMAAGGIMAKRLANARLARNVETTSPISGVPVAVAIAGEMTERVEVRARGFLMPWEDITLSTEVSGRVKSQVVEASDRVSEGDILFQIDPAGYEVARDRARAEADRAASELHQAEENRKRVQRLENEQSVNPTEVLEVETALKSARAVAAEVAARLAEANLLIERTTIRAPLTGVVSAVHTRAGEFAQFGQPLAAMMAVDRLRLMVQLSDREVVEVSPGDPVEMRVAAHPAEMFEGAVLRVHPRGATDSRKFEVEIETTNATGLLSPGFYAEAVIRPRGEGGAGGPTTNGRGRSVLTVPRSAVFEEYRQAYCYVIRRDETGGIERAYRTAIRVLPMLTEPQMFRVLEGVEPGERLVTSGLAHLTHESVVHVVE
ncbi:MAG: efflux RND transporter periplasmic adaptor subunit [Phycisphaerales bacterium]|nr:efflux RND transporter periplasmic adaptor subunit [Phycisphaerales bacterium]